MLQVVVCLVVFGLHSSTQLRVPVDLIVKSTHNIYLIEEHWYCDSYHICVDYVYVCPAYNRRSYKCYTDRGSLRRIQPQQPRVPTERCLYVWTKSVGIKGVTSLWGLCRKFCFVFFCYLQETPLAVVFESNLRGIDSPCKDEDEDTPPKDEDGEMEESDEDRGPERTSVKPAEEEPTIDQGLLLPEPTTPRTDKEPVDEPQYIDEPGRGGKPPQANEKLVADQSRRFTLTLLKAMRDIYEGENLLASPAAILAILKIFLNGARGLTRDQLERLIGKPYDIQEIMIKSEKESSLQMRTAFMYGDRYIIDEEEERILNNQGVETEQLPYWRREAAEQINRWLSQGLNKDSDIFRPENIDDNSLIVLNTLSFSGKFEKPFIGETIEDFQTLDGSSYEISMMTSREGEAYQTAKSKQLKADIVDLPYKNSELKMRLIIPEEHVSLKEVEDQLTPEILEEIDNNVTTKNITLKIPKVYYELNKSMEHMLTRIGLSRLVRNANLQNLFHKRSSFYDVEPIRLENFVHSAGINITEEGTTISSHSFAVPVSNLFRDDEIVANKPFLLFIEDGISHQILFFGRIGH